MPDFKKNDLSRRKYFELDQGGEDEIALVIPYEYLKTFHYCVSLLLEKDKDTEDPDATGYYITHRGTFKEQP